MTEQKKEIQTIKERTLSLKLSDADVSRIALKAGAAGLNVPELLENFIGDLVDGTYSNGSDERMYANQWFERCWFGMFPKNTFLSYLIVADDVESTVWLWNEIQKLRQELLNETDPEDIKQYNLEIQDYQEQMNDTFNEYLENNDSADKPSLESEMKKVIEWQTELKRFLGNDESNRNMTQP